MIFSTKILQLLVLTLFLTYGCRRERKNSLDDTSESLKEEVIPSHFDIVIAQINNDGIEFIADIEEIKSKWSQVISTNSDLDISFGEISIISMGNDYYLHGVDFVSRSKSIIKLELDNGFLYEAKYNFKSSGTGGGYTVTCSGCESTGPGSSGECEPSINPGHGYYCTDCSVGTCTKTTTYTPPGAGVIG